MTLPEPWKCTLHLEVRSRPRGSFRIQLEQRVYTCAVPASTTEPDNATVTMSIYTEGPGYAQNSLTTLKPVEVDLLARTAIFRESRAASDKLVERLEYFGWERVS